MSDPSFGSVVRGSELIRKIEKLGKTKNQTVQFKPRRGKGSHGTLFYGEHFSIIPDVKKELKTGTLHSILRALNLEAPDLESR